jgi:hypothetical protein
MARSLQNPIKQVPYMGLGLVCRISLLVMAGYIGMYVKMETDICIDALRDEYRRQNNDQDKP